MNGLLDEGNAFRSSFIEKNNTTFVKEESPRNSYGYPKDLRAMAVARDAKKFEAITSNVRVFL